VFKLLTGFVLLGLMLHSQAFAVGTSAGTNIDNEATVNYSVGGTPQATITSIDPNQGVVTQTRFTVDRKIDMSIVAAPTAAGSTATVGEMVTLTVTNDSNVTQTFLLNYINDDGTTDDIDLASVTFYEETGGVGGFDGTDNPITEISLLEDETKTVYAFAILGGSTNGDTSTAYYTLTASDGLGSPIGTDDGGIGNDLVDATVADTEIVFADGGNAAVGTNTASTDVAEDGLVSTVTPVTYTIAGLEISKSVAVTSNPPGVTDTTPKAVPGAIVTYTVSINNSGAEDATALSISDTLPTTLEYVDGSINFGTDPDCQGGADATVDNAQPAADVVSVTGLTVAGGAVCDVTFQAEIL
jgi:uncharacterized repeat protein (TIGR01451 family)